MARNFATTTLCSAISSPRCRCRFRSARRRPTARSRRTVSSPILFFDNRSRGPPGRNEAPNLHGTPADDKLVDGIRRGASWRRRRWPTTLRSRTLGGACAHDQIGSGVLVHGPAALTRACEGVEMIAGSHSADGARSRGSLGHSRRNQTRECVSAVATTRTPLRPGWRASVRPGRWEVAA